MIRLRDRKPARPLKRREAALRSQNKGSTVGWRRICLRITGKNLTGFSWCLNFMCGVKARQVSCLCFPYWMKIYILDKVLTFEIMGVGGAAVTYG